ncbi:MAG: Gfo/Idh/MocA family oxidoreductase [Oscillospiraceae bacterium]|nr:Gfo/Idh/MocA family oxidoreductase [Oscillospiraceae bacterium]
MNIGFIGAGRIANTLAATMARMEDVNLYAVAARDLDRAQAFAAQYGFDKAYGSYEEMLRDPHVELVYIATPHSHHFEHMKLCIAHGKNVLCEKAFTLNAAQAREVAALARERGVYVAEAIWTRYMPSRAMIDEVLASGIIGSISTLTCNLSYPVTYKERIVRPELAGGALLDVGIYGLNFALMHFGDDILRTDSSVRFTDTGVDAMETITLHYRDGRMAVITAGVLARGDRKGIFYGDKGYIIVENINNPQSIAVYDLTDTLVKKLDVPAQISGYEYQIREAMARIRAGEIEAASMPLDTTIAVMERMDALRKDWGLIYPMEK